MGDDEMNISLSSFWIPEDLPPSAWTAHAPFLFWLCRRVNPRSSVDLGGDGAPFLALCQAIERLDLQATACSVEPSCEVDGKPAVPARYAAFARRLFGDALGAADAFADKSVDLLHIGQEVGSAGHALAYEVWRPKLADDAVVLVHGVAREGSGAQRFFDALAAAHPSFGFVHGQGLGVLCPAGVPASLRGLLESDEAEVRATRAAYAALGDAAEVRAAWSAPSRGRAAAASAGPGRAAPDAAQRRRLRISEGLAAQAEAMARSREQAQTIDLMRRALVGRDRTIERLRQDAARVPGLERDVDALRRILAARVAAAVRRITRLEGLAAASRGRLAALRRRRPAIVSWPADVRAWAKFGRASLRDAREAAAVMRTGLFDPAWYRARYPDVAAAGVHPALHFVRGGWREGRCPNPAFDPLDYLATRPDVAAKNANPLLHFAEEGLLDDLAAASESGVDDHLNSDGAAREAAAAARAVADTGLFDADHYLLSNPDVAREGVDPALHYATSGWREGRNPSRSFDVGRYLALNPDVAAAGVDPLLHYAEAGASEGRPTLPPPEAAERAHEGVGLARAVDETGLFDEAFYRRENPGVASSGSDAVLHYARDGSRQGRRPCQAFDPRHYLEAYPDVAQSGADPLLHFAGIGLVEGRRPAPPVPRVGATDGEYRRWVERYDTLDDPGRHAIRVRVSGLARRPLISVVMPVYDPPLGFLAEAVASVQAQLYPYWELCIADDASTDRAVAAKLREVAEGDGRIKLVSRSENGHISAASNSALALAAGEFVALMDHDDRLPEHALFEVAAALERRPDLDILYSDEDHLDREGHRCRPYFKTDHNPELMLGHNMVNHLGVYRRSLLEAIGGFRLGYEGSQDYDLALRAIDAVDPRRILHIPRILYHWRSSPQEATFSQTARDRCTAAARAAIADHLARRGEGGAVVAHPTEVSWHRVVRPRPDLAPLVSVIVAAAGPPDAVRRCCDDILDGTDYPRIELIVIDRGSPAPEMRALLDELARRSRVRLLRHAGSSRFAATGDAAARHARGDVLAFLDEGIEVVAADWLDEMVALACRPGIGAVGAKLLDAERRVRHGGLLVGRGVVARPLSAYLDGHAPGYMGRAALTSAVSAVSRACLVVRREVFERVGGFGGEGSPGDGFADVDLCLRMRRAGFRNVFAAQAVLLQRGPVRPGPGDPREAALMEERWGDELSLDPYYNPNLAIDEADFGLAEPPQVGSPSSDPA